MAPVEPEEPNQLLLALKSGLVEVQVHTVDRFQFVGDVARENLGDAVAYTSFPGSG